MRRQILAVLAVAATSCGGAPHVIELRAGDPPVVELAVDGRSNAHVTLSADGGRLAAAWIASNDSGADVFAAVSEDGGLHFGAPVRVNDTPGDASGNGEQPPRVLLKGPAMTVVWVSKRSGVSGIRAAQSSDGGRTFAKTRTISPEGVTGARGWESATIDDAGVVHAVWLDGRHAAASLPAAASAAQAPSKTLTKHAHGDMRQDIVHAMWRDGEAVVETPVADNVCFCCKTGIATRGSDVYVVWRHIFPGGMRDIAIARSSDGGRTFSAPVRVSADNWKIDACPDDGPSLAIDGAGTIHVVWPTLVTDGGSPHMAIFMAKSQDGGATFSPRVRADGGGDDAASHPRVAVGARGTRFVWDETTGEGRRAMFGQGGFPAELGEGASGSYPAIVPAGDWFAVAWTEQAAGRSVIRVTLR